MLKVNLHPSKVFLWCLVGAYSGQFFGGFYFWLGSLGTTLLSWIFNEYFFGAPLLLGIGASLISIKLARHHKRINFLWLAFWSTLLSYLTPPLVDIFILSDRINGLRSQIQVMIYIYVLIQTSLGFLIMGILTAIFLILTRKREDQIDK